MDTTTRHPRAPSASRFRIPQILLLGILVSTASTCGGLRTTPRSPAEDLAWPALSPRVRLVGTIPLDGRLQGRGSKVLGWLGGPQAGSGAVFARPYAVAWDGEDLLVADPEARRLARIRPGGKLSLSPNDLFVSPIGVAVCPSGIVVSDSAGGRVALLGADFKLLRWLAEDLERPTGVACRGERIFVMETGRHRVLVLGEDGSRRSLGHRGEGEGELNFPAAMTVDEKGDLWIGDTLNFRIQHLDADTGKALGSFGSLGDAPGTTPRIKGLAVDREGNLWVSDAHLDQVSLFAADGTFLLALGGTGNDPGELSFPAGIAAGPDRQVAVVDSLNRRLQIFRLLPSPETGGAANPAAGGKAP